MLPLNVFISMPRADGKLTGVSGGVSSSSGRAEMTTDILDRQPFGPSRIDRAVSLMAAPAGSGSEFFETAVEALSTGLGCKWAVIGELINDGKEVNVLAFWNDGALSKPFSYSLDSGPCEVVYQTNSIDVHHFYPEQITKLFPNFALLKALGAEAYRGELFLDADGKPAGHVVALMDKPEDDSQDVRALFRLITQRTGSEHKRMMLEAALTRSEARYRELIDESPVAIWTEDWSAMKHMFDGLARDGVKDWRDYFNYRFPDVKKLLEANAGAVVIEDELYAFRETVLSFLAGQMSFEIESKDRAGDGSDIIVRSRAVIPPKRRNDWSRVIYAIEDITESRRTEERLKQAQKMEAVGQLTGGVAHDFNNLLAVIGGNAELLADDPEINPTLTAPIVRAVKRGAELTQRLLAFSRQQPLRPQVIAPGELVVGLSDLLSRALGETVEFATSAAPNLWSASADPGQVENALLNLVLNARDAMPNGGKLTVECLNTHLDKTSLAGSPDAEAGDYVVLAVSDDGTGMTEEVKAHAFEPFFTTKEVGEGSGLGLSMVYGFARQSGGHVSIYSEIGKGTTVKLYLPRAVVARQTVTASQGEDTIPRGQGEMILVIEDDPDVRALAVLMLESLEYQVIDACDATSAQKVLAEGQRIDLVLSDVVLTGGTSGPQFADEARAIYPGLKIIFMSGYPAEAAMHNGFLGSGDVLLNKPFERRQLATILRAALD
jgi:signal transduction histidine kinase